MIWLRLLDTNVISLYFIHSMQLALLPCNLSSFHVLQILSVTMHFYELIKYKHIRHFQLNKASIHKQLEPIKHGLLILNAVNALQFQSIYYFCFEKLQLFSCSFQQQSTLQIVDRPKIFSKSLLNHLIKRIKYPWNSLVLTNVSWWRW